MPGTMPFTFCCKIFSKGAILLLEEPLVGRSELTGVDICSIVLIGFCTPLLYPSAWNPLPLMSAEKEQLLDQVDWVKITCTVRYFTLVFIIGTIVLYNYPKQQMTKSTESVFI